MLNPYGEFNARCSNCGLDPRAGLALRSAGTVEASGAGEASEPWEAIGVLTRRVPRASNMLRHLAHSSCDHTIPIADGFAPCGR